eukprot:TRINITY_DN10262_c0_g1_i3.p1 TRINITY_DN10262_c0_g1~~TRINITY_DN10262_c0_g1_i3.p1  ORF type:complete len:389 (+),score=76.11 TRINITY_DN10262_c0_g1_i3:104-1270(+)
MCIRDRVGTNPQKMRLLAKEIDAARVPTRLLDRVTTQHHKLIDNIATRITSNSVFFPHAFFEDGWGNKAVRDRFERELHEYGVHLPEPHRIEPILSTRTQFATDISIEHGSFPSTCPDAEEVLPEASHKAMFELIRPVNPCTPGPAVVLVPGLGEPWEVRKLAAVDLARRGVTAVLLEGPFFGARKPDRQAGCKVRTASDLLVLGRATIEEGRSLIAWLSQQGYGPLAVAGCSMGGLHSGMIGSLCPQPVGIVGHLAAPSAHHAFCTGVLSRAIKPGAFESSSRYYRDRLIGELEEFFQLTELSRFFKPRAPSKAIFTVGKADVYLPWDISASFWKNFQTQWECDVREVEVGHVTGILLENSTLEDAVLEVLEDPALKQWYEQHRCTH